MITRLQAALCAALAIFGTPAATQTIAPDDRLDITILEWDPVSGTVLRWSDWAQEYRVDEDGQISLPFIGPVEVAGTKPDDLGLVIATRLLEYLALADLPSVVVDITERAPVTVSGLVRSAGAVTYRSGMTLRDALAEAGGVPLSSQMTVDPLQARLEAETLLQSLRRQEDALAARRARLNAEVTGAEEVTFPALIVAERADTLIARETELFRVNADRQARTLSLIDGRISLLENEITSLETRQVSLAAQYELAAEQLDAIEALTRDGLAVNARLIDARQLASSLEAQQLDVSNAILAARQSIADAESDRVEAVQGVAAQRMANLQDTEESLLDVRGRRVLQEEIATLLLAVEAPEEALRPELRRGGEIAPLPQGIDTRLLPGDLVSFRLDLDAIGTRDADPAE